MMSFRISGLSSRDFAHLYELDDAALAAHGARRNRVDVKPGFPDRVGLRDLEIGETALLVNYMHQPADGPYRASHAIYVGEGDAASFAAVDTVPEVLRSRALSLRAFDTAHLMVDADLVDGASVETLVERLFADPPSLAELAEDSSMSPFHFQRLFKATFGISPKQYAIAVQATRVRAELVSGPPVMRAVFDAGYATSSRFYDDAQAFGMSPSEMRAGGAGIAMHATVLATALGAMLVAATERGVCAVLFGADEAALRDDLARRFPHARIIDAPPQFTTWTRAIAAYVDRAQGSLDVPLDVVGTAFQRRVWQALRTIPPGTTATYSEIAERLHAPKSARAVARACAANPVAVAIPCHRVVRRDGDLGGYRWGLERKQTLLEKEADRTRDE